MTSFAAVLFDLYDTLMRSWQPPYQQQLSTRLGVSPETLLRAFATTRPTRWIGACGSAEGDMTAVVRTCGLDPPPEFVRELTAAHLEFLSTGRSVEWSDDALPLLASLRARGIKTAIVSNCDHWTQPVSAAQDLDPLTAPLLAIQESWPAAQASQAAAGRATRLEEWWSGGSAPLLVIQGLQDKVAPPGNGRDLKTNHPDRVSLVEIDGAGHGIVVEHPVRLADEIVRFIAKYPLHR